MRAKRLTYMPSVSRLCLCFYVDLWQWCSPRGQALASRRLEANFFMVQALALRFALTIFIARQHTDWRAILIIANLSVHPSVRPLRSSIAWNGLMYCHSFLHHTVVQSFWFYQRQTCSRNSDRVTPCGGTKYRWGIKFRDFGPITRYISQMIQDSVIVTIESE